jgi:hypothetical protein
MSWQLTDSSGNDSSTDVINATDDDIVYAGSTPNSFASQILIGIGIKNLKN